MSNESTFTNNDHDKKIVKDIEQYQHKDAICKAEMKVKSSKIFKIITILLFILCIIIFIPVHSEHHNVSIPTGGFDSYDNIFGTSVYIKPRYDLPFISGSFSIINLIPLFLGITMLIWKIVIKFIIKRCSLQLYKDRMNGNRKYLFSNKELKFPIEKVDNILIENGIIDKLFGGETVAICSSSGKIRFICIQNASEFVDKTLEAIKAYQESNKSVNENTLTNNGSDNLEKITKLKEMLDNGIITQEEFDTKKKQLLGL